MWVMIIYLCLIEIPHEQCNEDTAISVVKPIDRYPMSIGCAIASMQALSFIENTDNTIYPNVVCVQK